MTDAQATQLITDIHAQYDHHGFPNQCQSDPLLKAVIWLLSREEEGTKDEK